MSDKWTKYFDENREAMDTNNPPPDVWTKIKRELLGKKKKQVIIFPWFRIAASVLLIAGVTWFISLNIFKDSESLEKHAGVLVEDKNNALQEKYRHDSSDTQEATLIAKIAAASVDTSLAQASVDSLRSDSVFTLLLGTSSSIVVTSQAAAPQFTTATPLLRLNGGTSSYVYKWSADAAKTNGLSVNSGSYTVSVTDCNGCTTFDLARSRNGYTKEVRREGESTHYLRNGKLMIEGNWTKANESEKPAEDLVFMYLDAYDNKSKGILGDYSPETYQVIVENEFKDALKVPLSTFSIDVDAASYSNVRRYINDGQKPPANAVKIEEMINYFQYDYPQPPVTGPHPFSINTEMAVCPWNKDHHLVQIGLQGRKVHKEDLPNSNLVFLIDVSGSMNSSDKLELLKSAFKLLVREVREEDMVSIVVYAGAAGVVLEPTSGANKDKILDALMNLRSGGSTAGGQGIELAYKIAEENLMKNGNNRVILATDGDFNVGLSDDDGLVKLIEEKRKSGIFLTVLGFGRGNYQDAKMEKLADNGNGNHAYIDGLMEAQKVFVNEMGATLLTIAKDVKIQVEFNPAKVKAYRLVGYENRLLANKDFANDAKDAGEMGAGHSVTALYEVILTDAANDGIPLKYQEYTVPKPGEYKDEIMTVKLRYKEPKESKSKLITHIVKSGDYNHPSNEFQFATAVAEFAMLLRGSKFKGTANYDSILKRAKSSKGGDEFGYRAEFIKLVNKASIRNYHN